MCKFHSSDNNVYGQGDDSISPGLTEIGVNHNYQIFERLKLAAQGLCRRAGDVDLGYLLLGYVLVYLVKYEFAQYSRENFTLSGEYNYCWNNFGKFVQFNGGKLITESWCIEASYCILAQLQAAVHDDSLSMDKNDRRRAAKLLSFPNHTAYAKGWVFCLRYDVTESIMARADYTRSHGASWSPQGDNPGLFKTVQDWVLLGLQLLFRL